MNRLLTLIALITLGLGLPPAVHAQQAPGVDAGAVELSPVAAKFEAIDELQTELEGLAENRRATRGEERALIVERMGEKRTQLAREIAGLVDILTANPDELPAKDVVDRTGRLLDRERRRVARDLKTTDEALSEAKDLASKAESAIDRSRANDEVARLNERVVALLRQKYETTLLRERMGSDTKKDLAELDELLQTRARRLAALIEAAREERATVRGRPTTNDEEKKVRQRDVELITREIEAAATSLRKLIALMKERKLDTSAYQQLLIEATGRMTTDVFDRQVTLGLLDAWFERGEEWVADRAPQAFFALLLFGIIMLGSWVLSRLARRLMRRSVERTEMSMLAREFAVRTSGRLVLAVGLLTGLSQLGIEMAPVLAGLGIAGFVVGFALQDTLSNFAAGMMILVYRPFDVGDLVEMAGVTGKVHQMTLVSTSVLTLDNQKLIIPNNKIWNNVIRNVTAQSRRRVDFTFGVSYDDDIEKVMTVLRDVCENTEHVEADGEIIVALHSFGDSSVNFTVRVWTATDHYWEVFWAINAEVKRRFDAEDISIPFPQRDVHMKSAA